MSLPLTEYDQLDGLGLAELVRRRQVSAAELLDAALARVEARNPELNAVVTVLEQRAREQVSAGLPEGPFTGVPFLLKELGASLAGIPSTRGSRLFAEMPAPMDSEHSRRLQAAGLVIFGKTNTPEAGLNLSCEPKLHGPTRNPYDTERSSGGSSGGAAAAVAARIAPMAVGSDAFGSIRVPAACCGLIGLKPTRARNTWAPYFGEGLAGFATEHALTRTVRDSAALLDATAGPGSGDPYVAPAFEGSYLAECDRAPERLRIAVCSEAPNGVAVEADQIDAVRTIAGRCAELGHEVEDGVELPPSVRNGIVDVFLTLSAANIAANHDRHPTEARATAATDLEPVTYAMVERGREIGAMQYVKATQAAHGVGRLMAEFHQRYDLLLTPALATIPPPLGHLDMSLSDLDEYWDRIFSFSPFTLLANMTGQPAMVLPAAYSRGLPVGVQFCARPGEEQTLFSLAAQLERDQTPPDPFAGPSGS